MMFPTPDDDYTPNEDNDQFARLKEMTGNRAKKSTKGIEWSVLQNLQFQN